MPVDGIVPTNGAADERPQVKDIPDEEILDDVSCLTAAPQDTDTAVQSAGQAALSCWWMEMSTVSVASEPFRIQEAIQMLEQEGRAVNATVFGPPKGRNKNQAWQKFLQRRNVVFRPVVRGLDERREANDDAIRDTIQALSRAKGVGYVALLSTDTGFLSQLQDCIVSGNKVVLFIPARRTMIIRYYEENGMQVKQLPEEDNTCHVRALLEANGTGNVKLAEPYAEFLTPEAAAEMTDILQECGFPTGERVYLNQLIAKFWFAHSLGTLTVYPFNLAVTAMRDAITSVSSIRSWQSSGKPLAFFLPVSGPGTGKAAKFGSRLARRIFRGGGPFMLSDSSNLTCAALTELGYMDEDLNADLTEAIFCFVNSTDNKYRLRKLDLLPAGQAKTQELDRQLRQAFLSNGTDAQWRVGPNSRAGVQKILVASEMLPQGRASQAELFTAMGDYARCHDLPEMRTFNGRAWRIMRFNDRCPTTRGVIEVARP
ncbi:unnamed protein product [Effrenium voratum]|uniref:Uncharacterized protein n=1 Tax=Effrenium voratum TaxID=2562239 RepID=A0AA36J4V5_9DINO|nr:unnamed protein product [Effrenium voratum]